MTAAGDGQCFVLGEGYPGLPGGAITLSKDSSTEYVEVNLSRREPFKDFTISILVYPEGTPSGTLFYYAKNEIEKFRLNFIYTTVVVSFRDEYDNPAGLVPVEDLLVPDQWNHLVVQRKYTDGEITIYVDGTKKIQVDDGFQDNIPIPNSGMLAVGSAPTEPDQQFSGRIACLQVFDKILVDKPGQPDNTWHKCLSDYWLVKPSLILLPDDDNPGQHCLAEAVEDLSNLISLGSVFNEDKWQQVLQRFQWLDSTRNFGYFSLVSKGTRPSVYVSALGFVNTTGVNVCSRVCLRVQGCQSFAVDKETIDGVPCYLYNYVSRDLVAGSAAAKYYGMQD
ncbi:uncharacterized protein LOC132560466 [Ylistrum balloti]|uniref:uncharacterized protein LOC132560466 n=1 Tax=Ylistrum balloti TaxID=509963 RepID=UPI002905BD5A|nr:uncharacterized protein LOC132560466 [Ylistrum balloti]